VKQVSSIALHFVAVILTLHALVGHSHNLIYSSSEVSVSNPIEFEVQENWLKNFISIDLGEGHLDSFLISEELEFKHSDWPLWYPVREGNSKIACEPAASGIFRSSSVLVSIGQKHAELPFRGPPSFL